MFGLRKSSLAFGTLYAEAQRRYLESVSPYARRLFHQMAVPEVDSIDGLPPAVALQQQRGVGTTRSYVGSVTTLSNLVRMLYSRAGVYPPGQPLLYAESFSPNTAEGACPECHGLGRRYDVSEASMVPDPSLTIRERAVAAWPLAWQGQNLRDILTTLGFDVDRPWRELPRKDRDWILFTEEQPTVPVYAGFDRDEVRRALQRKEPPSYQGRFTSARRHVLQTFANTESALMKRRVAQYLLSTECSACQGRRLRKEALSVTFAGHDIAALSSLLCAIVAYVLRRMIASQRALSDAHIKLLAERNRELDLFAGRAAHDMRAPLSPIRGYADLLVHRGRVAARGADHGFAHPHRGRQARARRRRHARALACRPAHCPVAPRPAPSPATCSRSSSPSSATPRSPSTYPTCPSRARPACSSRSSATSSTTR